MKVKVFDPSYLYHPSKQIQHIYFIIWLPAFNMTMYTYINMFLVLLRKIMDGLDQIYDDEMNNLNNNASTTRSISINYKPHSIALFLKNNPKEWLVQAKMKKPNTKYSDVWSVFGEPSKINETGVYSVIDGFASCFKCYKTYIQKKDTGTNTLRNHSCF